MYEPDSTYAGKGADRHGMKADESWSEIVFNNREPVYLQVVLHFKERLATGRLRAGQVIPSRRELAALMKINPNTAQKAYKEMEDQRLIVTEGNSPSRITTDSGTLHKIRFELLEAATDSFVAAVRKVGAPMDELLELVTRKYIEQEQAVVADGSGKGAGSRTGGTAE